MKIVFKISCSFGYAYVETLHLAIESRRLTYPEAPPIDNFTAAGPKTRIFDRIGHGWFQIEAIEVKQEPQSLMPYRKLE